MGKLRAMGPDRKNLLRLMNDGKNGIGDLRAVAQGCPPELLSAHLCILAKTDFDRFPVEWLEEHEACIMIAKTAHINALGFEGARLRVLGEVALYCS